MSGAARMTFNERIATSEALMGQRSASGGQHACRRHTRIRERRHCDRDHELRCLGESLAPHIEIHGSAGSLSVPDPNRFDGEVAVVKGGTREWVDVPLSHSAPISGAARASPIWLTRSIVRAPTSRERRPRLPRPGYHAGAGRIVRIRDASMSRSRAHWNSRLPLPRRLARRPCWIRNDCCHRDIEPLPAAMGGPAGCPLLSSRICRGELVARPSKGVPVANIKRWPHRDRQHRARLHPGLRRPLTIIKITACADILEDRALDAFASKAWADLHTA